MNETPPNNVVSAEEFARRRAEQEGNKKPPTKGYTVEDIELHSLTDAEREQLEKLGLRSGK